jgi:hypothetical protein
MPFAQERVVTVPGPDIQHCLTSEIADAELHGCHANHSSGRDDAIAEIDGVEPIDR